MPIVYPEGCTAEVRPTTDDYFLYYPQMALRVNEHDVHQIIAYNEPLDRVFRQWCNDRKNLVMIEPEQAMAAYMQLLHTVVCRLLLHENARNGIKIPGY